MKFFMALVLAITVGALVHQENLKEQGDIQEQSVQERDQLYGRIAELEAEVTDLHRQLDEATR